VSSAPALAGFPAADPEEQRTLEELLKRIGARTICIAASKDPNAKVTLLLFRRGDARPTYVAKVPTTDEAAGRVEAETIRLRQLQDRDLGRLSDSVPRVVDVLEHRGRPVLLTTALGGRPMTTSYHAWRHTARPQAVAADFRAAGAWLAGFQQQTASPAVPLTALLKGVAGALQHRFAADPELAGDLAELADVQSRLDGHWSPRSVVHGDFWLGNLLIDGTGISGVVDWELAHVADVAVHDLVRFALTYSLYLDRHTRPGRPVAGHRGLRADRWGAGVDHAVDGDGWYPDLVQGFLAEGLVRLGIAPSCRRDVILAELAVIAAEADHVGFARDHLLIFRRLSTRGRR
jgi:aminoglycoside phosphotransferase